MSGSDRSETVGLVALICTVVVFVIGLTAGASLWSGQTLNENIAQPYAATTEGYQEQRGPMEGYWLPEISARDTYAQWAMALLTVIGTGVGLIGLKWIRDTFKQTKRPADEAFKANAIANLDQRPWMDIQPPAVALTIRDNLIFAHVYATAKNVGRSAATGITFTFDIVDIERVTNLGPVRDKVNSGGEARSAETLSGAAAFPNGSTEASVLIHTPIGEAPYVQINWTHLIIFVCCTYRLQDGKLGKTGRVFSLAPLLGDEPRFDPLDRFKWEYILRTYDYGHLALTE